MLTRWNLTNDVPPCLRPYANGFVWVYKEQAKWLLFLGLCLITLGQITHRPAFYVSQKAVSSAQLAVRSSVPQSQHRWHYTVEGIVPGLPPNAGYTAAHPKPDVAEDGADHFQENFLNLKLPIIGVVVLAIAAYTGIRTNTTQPLHSSRQYYAEENTRLNGDEDVDVQFSPNMLPEPMPIGDPEEPKGTVTGAATLIAGSMVGAGILALPAQTASVGFVPAALTIILLWLFMVASGLLIAEMNVTTRKALNRNVVSIGTMAGVALGNAGSRLVSFIFLLLQYLLLVAYFAKSGAIVQAFTNGAWPLWQGSVAVALGLGFLVYFGPIKAVDWANRGFTVIMALSFLALLVVGAPQAHLEYLDRVQLGPLPDIIPIIFLALVYQNIIPSICMQLQWDTTKIQKAIALGTGIPMLGYLLWNGIALSLVPYEDGVDPLQLLSVQGSETLQLSVQAFAFTAIATSVISKLLGLGDFFRDSLGQKISQGSLLQIFSFTTAVIPSLAFTLLYPEIFFDALQFAGLYGDCTLFGILTPLMAWKMRAAVPQYQKPLVPGGAFVLALMALGSSAVIIHDLAAHVPF